MNDIVDIVGKILEKDKESIYLTETGEIFKGVIKAFNKDGFVKVESLAGKSSIIKNPSQAIYMFPEPLDLKEIFEIDYTPKEKKPTERDFHRQLAVAKDIFGEGILDGDKVLFTDGEGSLKLGRTNNVEKDKQTVNITANKDKNQVKIETNGKNIYLLQRDYYIKEKHAYQ